MVHAHTIDEGLRCVCGSTPGKPTSWALWAEVLSPAGQLTNPQHCSGLPCESWEESFLNQGLQSQPSSPLPALHRRGWKEGGAIMLPLSNVTCLCHCAQFVPISLGEKLKAKFSWQGLSIQITTYIIIIFAGKMKTWRHRDIMRSACRESHGDSWVPVLGTAHHNTLLHGNNPGRRHCLHLICRNAWNVQMQKVCRFPFVSHRRGLSVPFLRLVLFVQM